MEVPVSGDSGLGVLLPEDISLEIDKWRRVYDPHHEMIPPHITVTYPPFVPQKEWPLVQLALVKCLRAFRPFNITLEELETFAGSPYVLWLKPEDGGNLSRIHVALAERFSNYVFALPFDYVPHLTVGFFNSREALSQAQEVISSGMKPLHFQVDELVYMVLGDNGIWRIRDRLPLGEPTTSVQQKDVYD